MKRGGEYSLKGTQELGERKGLKGERNREAEIMKRQKLKGGAKQRINRIGKQTNK